MLWIGHDSIYYGVVPRVKQCLRRDTLCVHSGPILVAAGHKVSRLKVINNWLIIIILLLLNAKWTWYYCNITTGNWIDNFREMYTVEQFPVKIKYPGLTVRRIAQQKVTISFHSNAGPGRGPRGKWFIFRPRPMERIYF